MAKKTKKQRIYENMVNNPLSRTDDIVLVNNMVGERIDTNLVSLNMLQLLRRDVADDVLNLPALATCSRARRVILNEDHPELRPPKEYNQRTEGNNTKTSDEYMENIPNFMRVIFKPETFSQTNTEMINNLMKSNFFESKDKTKK